MADQIVVLNAGRVMQVGAPMELYLRPQSRFVAEFIGAPKINIIEAVVVHTDAEATRIELADDTQIALPPHDVPAGVAVAVGFRPEDLSAKAREAAPSGVIAATVDVVEHLGAEALVYCKSGGLPDALRVRTEGTTSLASGTPIDIVPDVSACHLFDADGGRVARLGPMPAAADA